ncbi:hypothetical protein Ndes2526B_g03827 [Nannochloris sp. 'desiccata']|nr:hypothetical protein NADE_006744 [Chlorella desiccata (nom. nud.)]
MRRSALALARCAAWMTEQSSRATGRSTALEPQMLATRSFNVAKGLDRPPPTKIMVEYDSAEVDRFIDAADAIEDAFPGIIVDGIEVEDRPGAFLIFLEDGTEIFKRESDGVDVPSNDNLIGSLSQAGVRPAS